VDRDSQLDRSRAFAGQVHAIDFKKHLRPFQRIDEAHQLQVVSGKTSIDLDRNYAGAFRVLLLVGACWIRMPFSAASFPSSLARSESFGGKAVLVEPANLILGQHDLLVHAAQRFDGGFSWSVRP
jgi:hypothetical protein